MSQQAPGHNAFPYNGQPITPQHSSSPTPYQNPPPDGPYDNPANLFRVYPFMTYQPTARGKPIDSRTQLMSAAMHLSPHTAVHPVPTSSNSLYPQHAGAFQQMDHPESREDWQRRYAAQAQMQHMLAQAGPSYTTQCVIIPSYTDSPADVIGMLHLMDNHLLILNSTSHIVHLGLLQWFTTLFRLTSHPMCPSPNLLPLPQWLALLLPLRNTSMASSTTAFRGISNSNSRKRTPQTAVDTPPTTRERGKCNVPLRQHLPHRCRELWHELHSRLATIRWE